MGLIIDKKKHYLTRFPLLLIAILFIGFSPIIIGITGDWVTELLNGQPYQNEGYWNWMNLVWYGMYTIPISGFLLIIFLVIILIDTKKICFNKITSNELF